MSNNTISDNFNNAVNWKYLPTIGSIGKYSNKNDLLELSLVCTFFRQRFIPLIFDKMTLFRNSAVLPSSFNNSSGRKKKLKILINMLSEDLEGYHNLIKEVIFKEGFNNYFALRFVLLFPNIKKLTIHCFNYNCSFLSLYTALKHLKLLESVEFSGKLFDNWHFQFLVTDYKFPPCLKSIKIIEINSALLYFEPIEKINYQYTQLEHASIFNNRMLINLSYNLPKLTSVQFLKFPEYDPNQVLEFIRKNYQIKKLILGQSLLNQELANLVLSLTSLSYLKIDFSIEENELEFINLPFNTSIKQLELSTNLPSKVLIPILNSCKGIKILQFNVLGLYEFEELNWLNYNGTIHKLLLHTSTYIDDYLNTILNLKCFKIIEFEATQDLNYFIAKYGFDSLEYWKLKRINSSSFKLIKKPEILFNIL